jgi:sugar phosphate isomerase/epimerase
MLGVDMKRVSPVRLLRVGTVQPIFPFQDTTMKDHTPLRTKLTLTTLVGTCLLLAVGITGGAEPAIWPFFAFDNGVGRGTDITPAQQAEVLADMGYQGIGYTGVQHIPAMLKALDARGLKMFSTYVRVNLDGEPPFDPGLPQAIEQLRGHGTALWIHVHGRRSPDNALDDRAVRVIRQIARLAAESDLPVVLYPHTGFYVADNQDALRIVRKVDRENVGTSFNLCHFLKQQDAAEMAAVVRESLPYLRLVSVNGADSGETQSMGWDRLIQTLDRGTFDLLPLLKMLQEAGYRGPIGLQCYAVPGDMRDNLQRSIAAWRQLTERL